MQTHLVIIDGSAFIHRAFHARKAYHRERDGMNVNAAIGFTEMLWKTQRRAIQQRADKPGTHLVVVFDSGTKNFRHEIFPAYKANRGERDPELKAQFPLIRKATKAFGAYQIELDGYEADDIIATIAVAQAKIGHDVTIVTSDKDLMQLVGPMIQIWDPMAKLPRPPHLRPDEPTPKGKRMTADAVFEKFGVYPSELGDFLAIVGDTVDNVPGVPGVGEVGAADLIGKFQTIDGIYENIAELPPKKQDAFIHNQDQLRLSRRLVSLDENVPTGFDLDLAEIRLPKKLNVMAFLRDLDLRRMAETVVRFIEERKAYHS